MPVARASLIQRIGSFLSSAGPSGYTNFIRSYSSIKPFAISPPIPYDKGWLDPKSPSFKNPGRVQEAISDQFRQFRGIYRVVNPEEVVMLVWTENSLSGQLESPLDGDQSWEYPGENTVPIEFQSAIAETLANELASLRDDTGVTAIACFPATYDTGVATPDGKPIAINRAILVQDPQNQIVVDKYKADGIDGMGNYVIIPKQEGSPLETMKVIDTGGGRDVVFAVKTCAMLTQKDPFAGLQRPDVIIAPSRGTPRGSFTTPSLTFVADGQDFTGSLRGATGTYRVDPTKAVEAVPGLVGYSAVIGGDFFSSFVSAAMDWLNLSPKTVTQTKIGGVTPHFLDGFTVLEGNKTDIPPTLDEADLDHSEKAVGAGANIIDPQNAAPLPEDPVQDRASGDLPFGPGGPPETPTEPPFNENEE